MIEIREFKVFGYLYYMKIEDEVHPYIENYINNLCKFQYLDDDIIANLSHKAFIEYSNSKPNGGPSVKIFGYLSVIKRDIIPIIYKDIRDRKIGGIID